jgi:hypothetical protein
MGNDRFDADGTGNIYCTSSAVHEHDKYSLNFYKFMLSKLSKRYREWPTFTTRSLLWGTTFAPSSFVSTAVGPTCSAMTHEIRAWSPYGHTAIRPYPTQFCPIWQSEPGFVVGCHVLLDYWSCCIWSSDEAIVVFFSHDHAFIWRISSACGTGRVLSVRLEYRMMLMGILHHSLTGHEVMKRLLCV